MQKIITTIFIIDDDPDDKELLREATEMVAPGVRWFEAINGEEALRALQTPGAPLPDLIFLDLNMPRMNGKVFLRKIKQIDTLRQIPVIIYTTSKLEEDMTETKALGAEDFFTKPDTFDGICDMVSSLVFRTKTVRV
ncbi:MAG: response regulator [Cytophagaceae bacterium]|nr:response regulator [Cytophagaceae bacterium]